MRLFVIDNYDSFTYNLVHITEAILQTEVTVKRNDAFELAELFDYDAVVVSPGPGIPDEAGLTKEASAAVLGRKPLLGVCLGHQALGEVLGAELKNLDTVYHGVDCALEVVENDPLFNGLNDPLRVGRYHSWVIEPASLPTNLMVTATDHAGEIMALRHKEAPAWGVQFHPESVLTPKGPAMLRNFFTHIRALS